MKVDRKLRTYNPYLTFSNVLNTQFVTSINKLEFDDDIAALFALGRDAFSHLTVEKSEYCFNERMSVYFELIERLRCALKKTRFRYSASATSDEIEKYWDAASDEKVLITVLGDLTRLDMLGDFTPARLRQIFALQALAEIDTAIFMKFFGTGIGTVESAISAAYAVSNATAMELGGRIFEQGKRNLSSRGVKARKEHDPKQREKAFIFECWQQWQKLSAPYPTKAAFARDMLTKCEHLTSQKKIEDWCREWEATVTQQVR